MHVGTFTPEGTWARGRSASSPRWRDLGITVIEVMPVADFPGRFGWGYDGVNLFAPDAPLRHARTTSARFVDRAHALGLGVILDVVYNHLGPDGNYLARLLAATTSPTATRTTGAQALNFDGPAPAAREFFVANAGYWIDEFHLDGLRLDATQDIYDASPEHVLARDRARARAAAAGAATIYRRRRERAAGHARSSGRVDEGGYGLDALWNDDFHHTARRRADRAGARRTTPTTTGTPQELISARSTATCTRASGTPGRSSARGTPALDLPPRAFVDLPREPRPGRQLRARAAAAPAARRPAGYRALTALLLLGPATPMLFQGQEFASSAPFLYFADHDAGAARTRFGEGARRVPGAVPEPRDAGGRERAAVAGRRGDVPALQARSAPSARRTRPRYALHRDLLRAAARRSGAFARRRRRVDGAVLAPQAFVLRFFARTRGRPAAAS